MVITEPAAKQLIRRILAEGRFVAPSSRSHARREMDADGIEDGDLVNVLKGGIVRPGEYENGEWRYRVTTAKLCVVITFEPEPESEKHFDAETELIVVTAWRFK